MIKFRQKIFSEYDAMRSLYVEVMKRVNGDRRRFSVITTNELPAILRGNNVVVERFVISTSFFNRDKYRMYLKIGARAKLPDEVRLPGYYDERRVGNAKLKFSPAIPKFNSGGGQPNQQPNSQTSPEGELTTPPYNTGGGNGNNGTNQRGNRRNNQRGNRQTTYSETFTQKMFKGNNNNNNNPPTIASANVESYYDLSYTVHKLLGEAIKYDKKARTLVLEFDSIPDAINALNILPFGINYNIYFLNA